jgi:hypothetical protein
MSVQGNFKPHLCRACGWRPSPREYRSGAAYSAVPDWRSEPSVIALLFGRRPELAETATPGARVFAAVLENV